jgi:hypothetical protein
MFTKTLKRVASLENLRLSTNARDRSSAKSIGEKKNGKMGCG